MDHYPSTGSTAPTDVIIEIQCDDNAVAESDVSAQTNIRSAFKTKTTTMIIYVLIAVALIGGIVFGAHSVMNESGSVPHDDTSTSARVNSPRDVPSPAKGHSDSTGRPVDQSNEAGIVAECMHNTLPIGQPVKPQTAGGDETVGNELVPRTEARLLREVGSTATQFTTLINWFNRHSSPDELIKTLQKFRMGYTTLFPHWKQQDEVVVKQQMFALEGDGTISVYAKPETPQNESQEQVQADTQRSAEGQSVRPVVGKIFTFVAVTGGLVGTAIVYIPTLLQLRGGLL